MAIIGLFQCDTWCQPTQKWLKNATNDISIQYFHNITRHYVKDTAIYPHFDCFQITLIFLSKFIHIFKNKCELWCLYVIFITAWCSERPKPGFGIGNGNQGPISVSVSKPIFFFENETFFFKVF